MPGMIGSWPVRRSSPGHRTVGWSCSDGPVPHRVRRGVGGRRGAVGGRACASPRPAGGQVRALRAVGTPGGPVAGGAAEPGGRQPPVTGAGRARALGGVRQWHHGCRPRQPRRRRPPSRAPGAGGPGTAMPWRARRPGRADLPELPHGHLGPARLGRWRRLLPSPLQSNWRVCVRHARTGVDGAYFLSTAIGRTPHALGARILAEGLPMHVLGRDSRLVVEGGRIDLLPDPGRGSAPAAEASLVPLPERPADGPWRPAVASYEEMPAHCVPQDRALSSSHGVVVRYGRRSPSASLPRDASPCPERSRPPPPAPWSATPSRSRSWSPPYGSVSRRRRTPRCDRGAAPDPAA